MAPQGSSNHYPDYKCYYYLNNRYVLNNTLNDSEDVTKFSRTYTVDTPAKNNNILQKILPNLKKYLSDSNSFVLYDHHYICSYVSFLLHDQICKGDNNECDENIFNILKKFVDEFRKHSTSNICESKINYLSPSTYQKHKILYDLYDKYSIIIEKNRSVQDIPCNALHMLIVNYNESISNEGSDENFINKLIELKKLIKNNVLQSNTVCGRDITHFNDSHKEKREKELEEAKRRLEEEEKAEEQKRLRETEEKRQLQEALDAAQKQQQQVKSVEAQKQERRLARTQDEITLGQQAANEHTLAHSIPQLAEGHTWAHSLMDQLDPQFYGPENTRAALPGDQEGILDKMKSAISGIGEYVEPVPLMGVSGGMGALFLLFRVLEILSLHPLCTIHLSKNCYYHKIIL
ncbi:hypothetical protein PVBG_06114 [Plasmodium vivax Brazil I]|uniref:Uncharacterized protein n=1 Tax=Plasmodium vivax (strain Brazil I) TaxID=1033975 RepID=A0A0J9SZY1_PLAV1|nr:hypothetical protein PVBG_06114 [Plasmodium vivax Brazil I]